MTAETFAEVLAAHPVVVVHFWAAWDSYDRTMDAILRRLRPDFADRIAFHSCDIDDPDAAPIANAARVLNIPALACFIRGKHHETMIGLRPEQDVRTKLISWFWSGCDPGDSKPARSGGCAGTLRILRSRFRRALEWLEFPLRNLGATRHPAESLGRPT